MQGAVVNTDMGNKIAYFNKSHRQTDRQTDTHTHTHTHTHYSPLMQQHKNILDYHKELTNRPLLRLQQ